MIEVKAKSSSATLTKDRPHSPSSLARAVWVTATPPASLPGARTPDSRMIIAVQVHMISVSMNTLNDWTMPWLAGWAT